MADASAYPDERLRRPATGRSLRLGATRVSYVPDGVLLGRPGAWLPDTTERTWAERGGRAPYASATAASGSGAKWGGRPCGLIRDGASPLCRVRPSPP